MGIKKGVVLAYGRRQEGNFDWLPNDCRDIHRNWLCPSVRFGLWNQLGSSVVESVLMDFYRRRSNSCHDFYPTTYVCLVWNPHYRHSCYVAHWRRLVRSVRTYNTRLLRLRMPNAYPIFST